jgi:hypothetical protein
MEPNGESDGEGKDGGGRDDPRAQTEVKLLRSSQVRVLAHCPILPRSRARRSVRGHARVVRDPDGQGGGRVRCDSRGRRHVPLSARDPHVERLHYGLKIEGPAIFSEAPPFEVETPSFRVCFEGPARGLTVEMIEHHATEESARAVVESYLRAWEIHDAITTGRPQISFRFVRAELIDRDPPPPPEPGVPQTVEVTGGIASAVSMGGTVSVSRPFPKPPTGFAVNADTETLFERWRGHLADREPLPGMAYFCLTVLKMQGGKSGAAERFGVSRKVLDTIGRLCQSGDPLTARKASPMSRPLTAQETAWLEAAIRALIRRVGEVAADPTGSFARITMEDLPDL